MREENEVSEHLIRNLERISPEKSIFNYKSGRNAFLSLGQGNIREWLEIFLPNTRIILEPKIIGSIIGIQYINGELKKVINKNCQDITGIVRSKTELALSQGFSIITNDMNGKSKSQKVFNENGSLVSGVDYIYNVDSNGNLDNELPVVLKDGSIEKQLIGTQYDVIKNV